MKNTIRILFILYFITLFSCRQDKNIISEDKDDLYKAISIEIAINDSLYLNKEYRGELKLFHPLQDSIKTSKEDERIVSVYLNTFYNKNVLEITETECDTFYEYTNKLKDTLITPFYITPQKIGKQKIAGIIDEVIFLNFYKYTDTSKVRMLENRHYFEKKIYVKDSIGAE